MKNTLYSLLGAAALLALWAFSSPSFTVPSGGFVPGRGTPSPICPPAGGGVQGRGVHTAPASIKGRVNPADAATEVVAVSATDSVKANVTDGMFVLDSKPGTYKLIVVAKPPYKNAVKDNVEVAEGNATDVGTITLQE